MMATRVSLNNGRTGAIEVLLLRGIDVTLSRECVFLTIIADRKIFWCLVLRE